MHYRKRFSNIITRAAVTGAIAIMIGACSGPRIEGRVESVHGEAIPGVAVKIRDQRFHALTTGLGVYSIPFESGDLALEFIKSGYAPAELELPVYERRDVEATTVKMWRLPSSNGVFLYRDKRYFGATPYIPDRFETEDNVFFGTKRPIDAETFDSQPMLMIHRMPVEGLAFSRLERLEITLKVEGGQETPVEAWVATVPLPIAARAVDYPARLLHQIDTGGPLPPGAYAVHWGALAGNSAIDRGMYMFRVVDPNAPAEPDEPADEEGES